MKVLNIFFLSSYFMLMHNYGGISKNKSNHRGDIYCAICGCNFVGAGLLMFFYDFYMVLERLFFVFFNENIIENKVGFLSSSLSEVEIVSYLMIFSAPIYFYYFYKNKYLSIVLQNWGVENYKKNRNRSFFIMTVLFILFIVLIFSRQSFLQKS